MDTRASNPDLVNLQSKLRMFYELAAQCNDHCVKTYNSKALDDNEVECVKTCYKKQMNVYDSLTKNLN